MIQFQNVLFRTPVWCPNRDGVLIKTVSWSDDCSWLPDQSSQLARFSTYKTKLKNKQYHFKAPQVESHDVWESVAVIHFTMDIIKNHVKPIISHSRFARQCYYKRWGHLRPQLSFNSFYLSQQWNFYIPKIRKKKVSIPLGFHDISSGN